MVAAASDTVDEQVAYPVVGGRGHSEGEAGTDGAKSIFQLSARPHCIVGIGKAGTCVTRIVGIDCPSHRTETCAVFLDNISAVY